MLEIDASPNAYVLRRQPGAGRDDQCLDAGLQRGMENGCEFWAVVHWKFVEPVCYFRLRIGVWVCAADKPEN